MKVKDLKDGDILIGNSCGKEYEVIDFSKNKKVVFVKKGIAIIGMDNQTLNGYSLKEKEESYYYLKDGDVIKEGDEFNYKNNNWLPVRYSINEIFNKESCFPIRREIKHEPNKIQGFEFGKCHGELVEVKDDASPYWRIVSLKEVKGDQASCFIDSNSFIWKYCRPVPQEKRKFLDL